MLEKTFKHHHIFMFRLKSKRTSQQSQRATKNSRFHTMYLKSFFLIQFWQILKYFFCVCLCECVSVLHSLTQFFSLANIYIHFILACLRFKSTHFSMEGKKWVYVNAQHSVAWKRHPSWDSSHLHSYFASPYPPPTPLYPFLSTVIRRAPYI